MLAKCSQIHSIHIFFVKHLQGFALSNKTIVKSTYSISEKLGRV